MTSSEDAAALTRVGPPLCLPLTPTAVLAQPDGSGVVLGFAEDAGVSIEGRQARAVLVAGDGSSTPQLDEPGWLVAGQLALGGLRVLRARPGPTFVLLRAASLGGPWDAPLPTPARSLTSLCVVGPDQTWALGAGHLGRWCGGAWEDVAPPAPIDHRNDRLFAVDGRAVLATPQGLFLWREAKRSWGHRDVDGAHVRCLASPFIAARGAAGTVRIGRLEGAWVDWLGQVQGGADAAEFAWAPWPDGGDDRRALQLLLVPQHPLTHHGLVWVRSRPAGGFAVMRLAIPPDGAWAGVAGARGLLALTADRRPLQAGGET